MPDYEIVPEEERTTKHANWSSPKWGKVKQALLDGNTIFLPTENPTDVLSLRNTISRQTNLRFHQQKIIRNNIPGYFLWLEPNNQDRSE